MRGAVVYSARLFQGPHDGSSEIGRTKMRVGTDSRPLATGSAVGALARQRASCGAGAGGRRLSMLGSLSESLATAMCLDDRVAIPVGNDESASFSFLRTRGDGCAVYFCGWRPQV